MRNFDEDDWLAQRLSVLRPGWRGRLRLRLSEETKGHNQDKELIGTIVDEPAFDNDEDSPDDPTVIVCANHRGGHFVAVAGEPRFTIRVSEIAEMEAM